MKNIRKKTETRIEYFLLNKNKIFVSISKFSIAFYLSFFIFLLSGISSCTKEETGNPAGGGGLKFLVASNGTNTVNRGLYIFNPTSNSFEFVSPYLPHYASDSYLDYRNGRIAFTTDVGPKDSTPIANVDVSKWNALHFVPKPSAPVDYYYSVPSGVKPQIGIDGKILYKTVLNTDNPFDDFHIGQIAIFDPKTNKIDLTGDPSNFILSQPEKLNVTEGGSIGGRFAVSPDGLYMYMDVYGYGTEAGQYHIDNWYVVRREINSATATYERIAYLGRGPSPDHFIESVTGDGKYLVLSGSDEIKVDLLTKVVSKFDDYAFSFSVGGAGRASSKVLKMWRCGGIALFDLSANPAYQYTVIDPSKMTGPNRGLGHGLQFALDESKIFFTGSTDYCTNYDGSLRIYSSPLINTNIKPDSISTMPIEYCTGVFQLLGK